MQMPLAITNSPTFQRRRQTSIKASPINYQVIALQILRKKRNHKSNYKTRNRFQSRFSLLEDSKSSIAQSDTFPLIGKDKGSRMNESSVAQLHQNINGSESHIDILDNNSSVKYQTNFAGDNSVLSNQLMNISASPQNAAELAFY